MNKETCSHVVLYIRVEASINVHKITIIFGTKYYMFDKLYSLYWFITLFNCCDQEEEH